MGSASFWMVTRWIEKKKVHLLCKSMNLIKYTDVNLMAKLVLFINNTQNQNSEVQKKTRTAYESDCKIT